MKPKKSERSEESCDFTLDMKDSNKKQIKINASRYSNQHIQEASSESQRTRQMGSQRPNFTKAPDMAKKVQDQHIDVI